MANIPLFIGKIGNNPVIFLAKMAKNVTFRRIARLKPRPFDKGMSAANFANLQVLSAEFRVLSEMHLPIAKMERKTENDI